MPRSLRAALLALIVLAAIPAATARAVTRMPVGFYDDPSFRWAANPTANLESAQKAGASVIHVLIDWSQVAPTRPSDPLNGSDPAYHLADLDALSREAPAYGIEILATIAETPKWANGSQTPNHPPTKLADLTNFTQMLASRYNGTHKGVGIITHWSIWNEPNLQLFLTPQFSPTGKIVSPAEYVKLFMAGYKGLMAGNKLSQVAAGETSNRGRNHASGGNGSDTVAPATFANLVAKADPKLPFVAWATHPYPTFSIYGPKQKVAYPNVEFSTLSKFGASLKEWFHRSVPIWVTEYGEQTAPALSFIRPVSAAKQAADAKLALQLAQANPYVQMFVWFIFRDSTSATWFSGLEKVDGSKKPSYNAWKAEAKNVNGAAVTIPAGIRQQLTVPMPLLSNFDKRGATIGIKYTVKLGTKKIGQAESIAKMAANQSVSFPEGYPLTRGKSYLVTVTGSDKGGQVETVIASVTAV